ncbi:Formin-like protein 1 [Varanus komodoensis]|nr:Formin-like protein 1 [Varanus komodoensis]
MKLLGEVIRRCGLWNHQYADDTQLYLSFSTDPGEAVAVLNQCLAENSMNLPPDKMKLLSQYDNEKKWELICDQFATDVSKFIFKLSCKLVKERFQVKNPPSAYIQKLKSYLDTGAFSGKVISNWLI